MTYFTSKKGIIRFKEKIIALRTIFSFIRWFLISFFCSFQLAILIFFISKSIIVKFCTLSNGYHRIGATLYTISELPWFLLSKKENIFSRRKINRQEWFSCSYPISLWDREECDFFTLFFFCGRRNKRNIECNG